MPNRDLIYREFGIRLGAERKRKRLSQAQLAELVGLSRTSITNIECGRQPIQLHQLYSFASILRIEAHGLLPKESTLVPEPPFTTGTKGEQYLADVMKSLKAVRPLRGEKHG